VSFEGVALKNVLEKAGVTFGESMKGKRLTICLLVEAADGYRAVIALPELDPAFTDRQTLLVFLRDGKSLSGKEGPYRIVIPDEKRMARWVRQVTTLKIVDVQ
jgi:Oxidoreductase molybdopterin binding domain